MQTIYLKHPMATDYLYMSILKHPHHLLIAKQPRRESNIVQVEMSVNPCVKHILRLIKII